jgi:hypothetical protein
MELFVSDDLFEDLKKNMSSFCFPRCKVTKLKGLTDIWILVGEGILFRGFLFDDPFLFLIQKQQIIFSEHRFFIPIYFSAILQEKLAI